MALTLAGSSGAGGYANNSKQIRMSDVREHYLAYLVRFWSERGSAHGQWRASIEDPRTGERRGFGDLEELFAFLRERVKAQAVQAVRAEPPGGGTEPPAPDRADAWSAEG